MGVRITNGHTVWHQSHPKVNDCYTYRIESGGQSGLSHVTVIDSAMSVTQCHTMSPHPALTISLNYTKAMINKLTDIVLDDCDAPQQRIGLREPIRS